MNLYVFIYAQFAYSILRINIKRRWQNKLIHIYKVRFIFGGTTNDKKILRYTYW